jgi:CheY-like chemotaxis protein
VAKALRHPPALLAAAAPSGGAETAPTPAGAGVDAADSALPRDDGDSLFRRAHERSPDPFELLHAVRRDGRVVDFAWEYLNPAAETLLGRRAGDLVGASLLNGPDPSFQAARCAHWSEVMAHGEARRAAFSRVGVDGSVTWYESMSLPLGECVAVQTRDASAYAADTRRRGTGWSDDLLSSVSHELRTPLNAIVGWSHLLGRAEADAQLTHRAADAIGRNARALASLVDDLLDINRIVTGTLALDRQRCDVATAVRRAVDAVRPAAQARWVHLHTDEVADALPCWGDPRRLEQLLGNLLTRAVQSTPLDGTIHVAAHADGSHVRIRIRDSGEGSAGDAQLHDRFGQADSTASRRHGGLGLGLAIVRSLVELHGGRLLLSSDGVGLGTTVEVELPLAAQGESSAEAVSTPVQAAVAAAADAAPDAPLAWRRILVLEDEADSLELMTVLLRQQGAIVQAYDNAEQALAAAENGSFDLIISDLGMAGMDGLEFMRRLKRRPVPVKAMALTAYAGDATRAQALDAGYSRVEIKPISPPEFLAVVCAEATGLRPAS